MTIDAKRSKYDVIIVGGGVCGALVALKLSQARRHVLLLEAGTSQAMDPGAYRSFLSNYYMMGKRRNTPNGPYPSNFASPSPDAFKEADRHYVQEGPQRYLSDYLRMLGGTTLHWQGTSLRMLPNDFLMYSEYQRGIDWPITYSELEPWYRAAEREIGVSANVMDQQNLGVWFPPGYVYPMERMPQSLVDAFFLENLSDATVTFGGGSKEDPFRNYPLRVVSLPVARNSAPNASYDPVGAIGNRNEGNRCQGNSSCTPLCPVQAKYSALKTLNAAVKLGHLEIRSQCVGSRLQIDSDSGRVVGVEYKRYLDPDSPTNSTSEVAHGTIVVLAANAIQNTVMLLSSEVCDRSKQLGRNLMDHPYVNLYGLAPRPIYPFRGPDTTSGVESLRDGEFRKRHAAFRAGISNWGWTGEPAGSVAKLLGEAKFGQVFRDQLRNRLTRMVKLNVMIEQLPDPKNRVTIRQDQTDRLGNYLPILNYSYDDYTLDAALKARYTMWPTICQKTNIEDEMDRAPVPGASQAITKAGKTLHVTGSGHIVGTHRMGRHSKDSVVDQNLRSWTNENLYLVGAGSMVTIGTANPTLTAAALSLRAADFIVKTLQ